MALDGIFLHAVNSELQNWVGSRVNNVFQVSKFNFVLELRFSNSKIGLLVSANPSCARVNLTKKEIKPTKNESAFFVGLCNIVKGCWLVESTQLGFDRVLFLEFEQRNEMAENKKLVLAVELVGKHSNLILFERQSRRIIDALVRFNDESLGFRAVEPGRIYCPVGSQNKLNILTCNFNELIKKLFLNEKLKLSEALVATIEGVSPVVARELVFDVGDEFVLSFSEAEKKEFVETLKQFKKIIELKKFKFFAFLDGADPKEFCWFKLKQFGSLLTAKEFESASELLDYFYDEKVSVERNSQRCYNIVKQIGVELEKMVSRKAGAVKELEELLSPELCKNYADLLNLNLKKIERGSLSVELKNVYGSGELVKIELNSEKTPSQNAQAYYKKFKELKAKRQSLQNLISGFDVEIALLKGKLNLALKKAQAAETDN